MTETLPPSDPSSPPQAVSGPDVAEPLAILADAAAMVRFYSRLPLPSLGPFDRPETPPPFARACRMLPLASLVIALPGALTLGLLSLTALPPFVSATVALTVLVLTTGGLHEDGLADLADGFGGGATRDRKLAIMKDSAIGSYGTLALVLATLARVSLMAAAAPHGAIAAAAAVIAAAIVSRATSLALFHALPPARAGGVASGVGQPERKSVGLALVLASLLAAALLWPWFGPVRLGLALILAALASLGIARMALRQIGGQTGDVIGAAQQLAEIACLIGLAAI